MKFKKLTLSLALILGMSVQAEETKMSVTSNVNVDNGKATVIIKKGINGDVQVIEKSFVVDDETDIDALIQQIMEENGIENGSGKLHKRIIKLDRNSIHMDNSKPRLGFMASVKDDGWEVLSVSDESGAAEAGLQAGDLIKSIDDTKTGSNGMGLKDFVDLPMEAGQVAKVSILRDDADIMLDIEAKVLDSPDILMNLSHSMKWIDDMAGDMTIDIKGSDISDLVGKMGLHDIHVVTSTDANTYFFSNSKMSNWLGKNHHFSSVNKTLGKYFGVKKGVLVLEVDAKNKLGLKDGDVILKVNGESVTSPKDVVKKLSALNEDDIFEIQIMREKRKLYLET